jgi:hypothetical protein
MQRMIWIKSVILAILLLCSFALIFKYVSHVPYFYISIELFLILIFIAFRSKRLSTYKAILINLSAIVLAIGFAEAYFAGWQRLGFLPEIKEGWFNAEDDIIERGKFIDKVRGYALPKNVKFKERMIMGNEIIYDVDVTSNKDGLRISPHDLNYLYNNYADDFKNIAFLAARLLLEEELMIMRPTHI